MLTKIYIEALLVDEELADQVFEAWDKGEIDEASACSASLNFFGCRPMHCICSVRVMSCAMPGQHQDGAITPGQRTGGRGRADVGRGK